MDQQQQNLGVPGPAGRRLHIAHRRSPSEMTPLLSESSSMNPSSLDYSPNRDDYVRANVPRLN